MASDEHEISIDELIPGWALRSTNGQLELGSHLATRDGRRTGNAHIIAIEPAFWDSSIPLYRVLTDAGTTMALIEREIDQLFYRPKWVSDVAEVNRLFSRKKPQ